MLLPASGGRGWQTSNKLKYPYGWLITGNKPLTDQETTDHEVNIFVKVVYYEDRFLFQKPVTQISKLFKFVHMMMGRKCVTATWFGSSYSVFQPLSFVYRNFHAFNPSHPYISMHILHTALYSFPHMLTGKTRSCKEKLDTNHSLGV